MNISGKFLCLLFYSMLCMSANAADYDIDTKGAHAFINAKFMHLGYSVLHATFKRFDGSFSYDPENIEASSVNVIIDVTSLDSNHAKRDEHMTNPKYLNSAVNKQATFISTKVEANGDQKMLVHGELTLNGVTKTIVIDASMLGGGKDPWGGYRVGFEGYVTLQMADFNMPGFSGPVEMELFLEGIRK